MRSRFARILRAGPVNPQYLVPGKLFSANGSATPKARKSLRVIGFVFHLRRRATGHQQEP